MYFILFYITEGIETDVDIINPTAMSKKYQEGLEQRQSRVIFEDSMKAPSFVKSSVEDQLKVWKSYIKFEESEKSVFRVQRLFERALLECKRSEGMNILIVISIFNIIGLFLHFLRQMFNLLILFYVLPKIRYS